jgi:hypothetical protein
MGMTRMAWTLAGWRKSLRSIFALALVGVAVAALAENGNRPVQKVGSGAIGSDVIQAQKKALLNTYLRAPLQFEANQGQADRRVRFLSRGAGYSLFLTSSKAVLSLRSPAGKEAAFEMVVAGSDPSATVSGVEPAAARSNYFRGNDPAQWRTNVPKYGKVQYRQLYPGIDLTFYGNQRRLEYDFVIAPGADPHNIRLQFQGMNRMRLDREGELHLQTAAGEVRLDRPVLYQENADGSRTTVQGSFAMARHEVFFTVGGYDKSRPLVIDPVLSYSTFLGGSSNEDFGSDGKSGSFLSGIAVGGDGSVYVTGTTSSTDFPTSLGAAQTAAGGGVDVFVTKFNPSGTALSYSTYLGGSSNDFSDSIAIDSSGNAYIAGSTSSSNFPTTAGAVQTSAPTSNCGFVTKLNPAGNALVYSTFLGGSVVTELTAIAVDSIGNAYVTGLDNQGFPTTAGAFQTTVPGQENAVVAKLAVDGKTLVYSTYIGGEKVDIPRSIAVDALGNAYIAGFTNSVHFPILPAVGALQSAIGNSDGTNDAFVSKINSTGTALLYSTYLGGSGRDEAYAIAIDSAGSAYVTGLTASTNFPTASPLQSALGGTTAGDVDAFVAKLSSSGTSLVYSTYLGGGNPDFGEGIAVDGLGDAYVAGVTGSSAGVHSFPVLNSLPTPNTLETLGFVTEYNPTGSAFIYSTLFGGSEIVEATAIALDANGITYITGVNSFTTDMPVTPGVFQTSLKGSTDAFVAKLWPLALTPSTLAFPNTNVSTTSAPLTATLTNSGFATLNISNLAIATGNTADFAETTTCGSTLAPQSSCTISVTFMPLSVASFASAVNVTDDAAVLSQVVTLTGNGVAGATVPEAVLTPTAVAFGNQAATTTSNGQVVVLSNPGTATLNISSVTLTGTNPTIFALSNGCGTTLAPGASCNISATFTPPSSNSFSASLTVTDNATPPTQAATLAGTGTAAAAPQEVITPSSLVFAATTVGTNSATQIVTLSNPGMADLLLSGPALTGANPTAFSLGTTCTSTIAAGASCIYSVTFTPKATGNLSAALAVTSTSPGIPVAVIPLSGSGTAVAAPQAVLSPASLAFGNLIVGTTSAAQAFTLSNPGTAPLSITSIGLTGTNASGFSLTNGCGTTLAVGASCNLSITFTPTSQASYSASVTVVDNASGSPHSSVLTGAGIVPDFSVASSTPPQTVIAGVAATYQINVASATGTFSLPVTLSAVGLPTGATAVFTPPVVTPGGTGATSSLSIQTAAAVAVSGTGGASSSSSGRLLEFASAGLVMASCCFFRRKTRWHRGRTLAMVLGGLIAMSLGLTSCGGGFPSGKNSTTYLVTVTGTNASDQHSTSVTLTVQ